jgi:hypothetical protein
LMEHGVALLIVSRTFTLLNSPKYLLQKGWW